MTVSSHSETSQASEISAAEDRYAADYAEAFDDFVRSMRRQGRLVDARVLEGAHERAADRAAMLARSRGQRSLNFRRLGEAGFAVGRARWGG